MSDLNVYTTAEINALSSPVTGDLVLDSSLNAVKLYNGSTWKTFTSDGVSTPYPNGWGVEFNGTNHFLNTGYIPSSSATALTQSFWMKSTNTTGNMTLGMGDYITSPANAHSFRVLRPSGTKAYYVIVKNSSGIHLANSVGGQDATISGSTNICDGLWHHVVFTIDGTAVKIYIDGGDAAINASNTSNSAGPALTNTSTIAYPGGSGGPYVLGKNGNSSYYYFDGLMDDMAVFEYALTDTQVRSVYNNGKPNDISSLSPSLWYRMGDDANASPVDNTSTSTLIDSSGNGNNATQATAAWQPKYQDLTGESINT